MYIKRIISNFPNVLHLLYCDSLGGENGSLIFDNQAQVVGRLDALQECNSDTRRKIGGKIKLTN